MAHQHLCLLILTSQTVFLLLIIAANFGLGFAVVKLTQDIQAGDAQHQAAAEKLAWSPGLGRGVTDWCAF
jgi:hypothetical protein